MKTSLGILAGLALAAIGWVQPSQAQAVPQGSYLQSCSRAYVRGDRLTATCRRADGRVQVSVLPDVGRCVGDIGNQNGELRCNYAGGPPAGRPPGPGPGYGPPPGPPPPGPGYGPPPPGYGPHACARLHRQHDFLRDRLRNTSDPGERQHLIYRLHQLRDQERNCR